MMGWLCAGCATPVIPTGLSPCLRAPCPAPVSLCMSCPGKATCTCWTWTQGVRCPPAGLGLSGMAGCGVSEGSGGCPLTWGLLCCPLTPLQYVRLSQDTPSSVTYQLMTQHWGLDVPNLLISVTGGAKDFNMKPRLKSVFRRGLVKVAQTTGRPWDNGQAEETAPGERAPVRQSELWAWWALRSHYASPGRVEECLGRLTQPCLPAALSSTTAAAPGLVQLGRRGSTQLPDGEALLGVGRRPGSLEPPVLSGRGGWRRYASQGFSVN